MLYLSLQWRTSIYQMGRGGANLKDEEPSILFGQIFAEKCIEKRTKLDQERGVDPKRPTSLGCNNDQIFFLVICFNDNRSTEVHKIH